MDCTKQKSLDELLGQALAEQARQDQVEVTYDLGDCQLQASSEAPDDEDSTTEPLGSIEQERRVGRSAVTLGLAMLLLCNGFHLLQGLQTSLFGGAGLAALLATHGAAALACPFAPPFVRALTARFTLLALAAASCVHLASFVFYSDAGFVAGGATLGLALSAASCACATQLSLGASRSSCGTRRVREARQRHLLRTFYVLAGSGRFWANLVAWLVVRMRSVALVRDASQNDTETVMTPNYDLCFAVDDAAGRFEDQEIVVQYSALDGGSVRLLAAIYVSCVIGGVALVLAFLERPEALEGQDPQERPVLLQALRQMRLVLVDRKILLCIPLAVFTGLEQGFIVADFTRSYVNCALGPESVLLTMLCLGGCTSLGCAAVHLFTDHFPRPVALAAATACQSGLLLVLHLWRPNPDDAPVLYVVAGGWGLCHAVWDTLLATYFASVYRDDWQVPFAALHLLQSCGTVLALAACDLLPLGARVCVLAVALAASVVPQTVLEFRLLHRNSMRGRKAML